MTPTLPAHLSAADFHRAVLALAPRTAVFDCDGTLWGGDAGYGFMLWSIKTGLVSRNAADWIDSRYRLYRTGDISELAICGEMVQLYTGLEETELRRAAATFFRSQIHPHIFPEMQRLVADLHATGCEIWAVSSTNNWVIEEGVRDFGIPPERILAARVAVVERPHHQHAPRRPHRRGQGRSHSSAVDRATAGRRLRQLHPRRRHARTGPRAIRRQPDARLFSKSPPCATGPSSSPPPSPRARAKPTMSAGSPRIAALQPSISIILDRLGALDTLVACTRYCVEAVPALAQLPVTVVKDSWSCTTEEILAAHPNLVLASVPYRMESLAALLKAGCPVVTLAPHTLADIYATSASSAPSSIASKRPNRLSVEMQRRSRPRAPAPQTRRGPSSIAKSGASHSFTRSPGSPSWSKPPAGNFLATPRNRLLPKPSPLPIPMSMIFCLVWRRRPRAA